MRMHELLERLNRIPDRGDNPQLTALQVVRDILGDRVETDSDRLKPGQILVIRSWTGYPMFSSMDEAPGQGGAIGLIDLDGRTAVDVAAAAHEAFHALLHINRKNSTNEHLVNRLTIRWLQDRYSGMMLHHMLDLINKSKISYKRMKYTSSKSFIDDYHARFNKQRGSRW